MATSKINNNAIFKTASVTASGTVNAGTNARIVAPVPVIDGFTAIAIKGVQSSAGVNAAITEFGIRGGNVESVVRNVGTSQLSVSHTYILTYVLTAFIQ